MNGNAINPLKNPFILFVTKSDSIDEGIHKTIELGVNTFQRE